MSRRPDFAERLRQGRKCLNNVALDAMEANVAQAANLPGAAHLELIDGVVHLDPKAAVLEAMVGGWVRQQQTRFLNEEGTIKPRVALLRRLVDYTNSYPWEWQPADIEEFIAHLRSPNRSRPIVMFTGRGYAVTLSLFMTYVTDRRYGWPEVCLQRFGEIPQQIFHEDNRVAHVVGYEGELWQGFVGQPAQASDCTNSARDGLDCRRSR